MIGSVQRSVVVLGSVNLDVVAEVDHLPRPGETLTATAVRTQAGGKGANQAVAALRCGAQVRFVARTGDDPAGAVLREALGRAGLDLAHVRTVAGVPSGTAYITTAGGENVIVLDRGANHAWPGADGAGPDLDVVRRAAVLVLQHEVPAAVVAAAARAATGRVVLNAAPSAPVADEVLALCDPLVVNEHELRDLTGEEDPRRGLADLAARGTRSVVVTLGAAGALWWDGATGSCPAPRVEAVDSTGAGDALVGALAARLAAGAPLAEAVPWAVAAASLSVGRVGTHDSYPTAADVEEAVSSA
ncbi:ribokinase [Kineococcus xinjiangensis]|uniref:Ribokinase n=1 Tax=Kineococcus xinjiangensis TaxID=512762 RepID=A0A2S6IDM2_9ACTN|nr:ribokinase [Kineococcus xinjiangensis]PPK92315.1 ribokinase [Kineococcus xinjiangensis]